MYKFSVCYLSPPFHQLFKAAREGKSERERERERCVWDREWEKEREREVKHTSVSAQHISVSSDSHFPKWFSHTGCSKPLMVKQQHSVRPCAHVKAATMDEEDKSDDGRMTVRVSDNDKRYWVYIVAPTQPTNPPANKRRAKKKIKKRGILPQQGGEGGVVFFFFIKKKKFNCR